MRVLIQVEAFDSGGQNVGLLVVLIIGAMASSSAPVAPAAAALAPGEGCAAMAKIPEQLAIAGKLLDAVVSAGARQARRFPPVYDNGVLGLGSWLLNPSAGQPGTYPGPPQRFKKVALVSNSKIAGAAMQQSFRGGGVLPAPDSSG